MKTNPALTPRLVCRDADAAIEFYQAVLGAKLIERYAMPNAGPVVHAALELNGSVLALTEESKEGQSLAPPALGGTPVILQLEVDDPDALQERALQAGAKVVFPVSDQFYGRREGRLQDPFGHLWIIGKETRKMSPEEIQRGVDAWGG